MFENLRTIRELNEKIVGMKVEISDLDDSLTNAAKQNEKLKEIISKHDEAMKELNRKHSDEVAMAEREAELKFKEDHVALIAKHAQMESEVAMLNKAFENLGFDVKDMKEILNKLVDGLVTKNTISVIK